ncbi:MAG: hypothetical protein ACI4U0_00345 [Candidatus Aphodocola sp.]
MINKKYVRVMDGLKSNANGQEFKLNEIIVAGTWNPSEQDPEKMGGFNFSIEEKILRYIFRGDTIYDVIIPEDAEVVECDSKNAPNAIYRANKIIVTNPRPITEEMVIDLYKKSTLPTRTHFQCIYCLLFRKYVNASKYIIKDIVNKDNVDIAIKEFEVFASRSNGNNTGVFDYDKLFYEAKEIYDVLKEIQSPLYISMYIDKDPYIKDVSDDKIINITGESGSGKSYYSNKYINDNNYIVIDTDIVFSNKESDNKESIELRKVFIDNPKDYLITNFDDFYNKTLDYFKDSDKTIVIDSAQYRNIKDVSILKGKIIVMRTSIETCYERTLNRYKSINKDYDEKDYQSFAERKKGMFSWYKAINKFLDKIDILK